jgi:hypothetical protein
VCVGRGVSVGIGVMVGVGGMNMVLVGVKVSRGWSGGVAVAGSGNCREGMKGGEKLGVNAWVGVGWRTIREMAEQ